MCVRVVDAETERQRQRGRDGARGAGGALCILCLRDAETETGRDGQRQTGHGEWEVLCAAPSSCHKLQGSVHPLPVFHSRVFYEGRGQSPHWCRRCQGAEPRPPGCNSFLPPGPSCHTGPHPVCPHRGLICEGAIAWGQGTGCGTPGTGLSCDPHSFTWVLVAHSALPPPRPRPQSDSFCLPAVQLVWVFRGTRCPADPA